MANRDADQPPQTEGFPGALSPGERSALRRRWRPLIPLALAVLSLVSLVLVLLRVERQTRASLEAFSDLVDPTRAAVTTIELTLALESSDVAGFLLTGDQRFVTSHLDERSARMRAQAQLVPFAARLGPRTTQSAKTIVEHLAAGDATLDSLYDGRLSRASYTARLDDEQARFASVLAEAAQLERELHDAAAARRAEFVGAQEWAANLSTILAISAGLALALLARLGAGFQARAISLDAREQQQSALRETARALNASVGASEAARIVADGALAGTTALGAIVELTREDDAGRVTSTGVAVRGAAPRTTDIPYDESLTSTLADSGEAVVETDVEPLLDRMGVPARLRRADLRGSIVPIVSGGRVFGALAVVRPTAPSPTIQREDSYLGALMDLASSGLRRVELVSQLSASEKRFRQVTDNIRGFVWLREPNSFTFLYANAAYEEIWGRSRASLYRNGLSLIDGVHPDDRAVASSVLPPARPGPYEIEYRVVRPNGDVRWVWSRGFPVRDEQGKIYRMAGVTEDITERKLSELAREQLIEREQAVRAAAELRREELERVTESRTRLVRGFTHDVKNPLGAADGFLALLEEGVFGELSKQQHDSVTRARGSIHRALELIAGALELARADAAELELERVAVDLRDTITEVTSEYHAQAEAKGQKMSADVARDVPAITSDPARIRQIVGNLLSNAIKYTPPDGHIAVQVACADGRTPAPGDWVVVDVSDTGPGIPPDQVPSLFKEFTRLNPEVASGAGVGLAISQRLARALGGRITVESREGEGSRFSLWLPRNGTGKLRRRT